MNTNIITVLLVFFSACNSGKLEKNLEYQPFSKSVIAITFNTKPPDTVYLEARTFNNVPRQGTESDIIPVEDKGTYYLTLVNDRPSTATLALDDEAHKVIIYPKDTTYLIIRSNKNIINFKGKGKSINEYYQAKHKELGYTDLRYPLNEGLQSVSSYQTLVAITDSLINIEIDYLENYIATRQLPSWFIQYEKAEIKYQGMGFKTFLPKYNEMANLFEDTLSDQYYTFIQIEDVNNPSAIGSSKYWWFLDDYFLRDLPLSEFNSLAGYRKESKLNNHKLKHSKTALTGEVKEVYHQYLLSSLVQTLSDTSTMDSLARVYEVQDYKKFYLIAGTRIKHRNIVSTIIQGDTIPPFYVIDPKEELSSIRDYQDKVVYINFWATWCSPCIKNIPALNQMINAYQDNDQIAFLNICLESEKEKWLTSIKRYDLKGDNLYADGNWNEKLKATFAISGIPTYVLLHKGNILFENHTNKAPTVKSTIDEMMVETPHNKKQLLGL